MAGPWLAPSGEDNAAFFGGLRAGLLNAVVTYPGVSVASLAGEGVGLLLQCCSGASAQGFAKGIQWD